LYVLRDYLGSAYQIVVKANDSTDAPNHTSRDVFSLPRDWGVLLSRLMDVGFLKPRRSQLEQGDSPSLAHTLELLFAQAAYAKGLDRDFDTLNPAELASWKQQLRETLPAAYTELRQVSKQLKSGGLQSYRDVKIDVWVHLLRPNEQLSESTQAVLWHLLSRVQPENVEMTYRHHKALFYQRYESWPKAQRYWALNYLTRLGLPHHE
jgi:hypothetical protein